MVVSDAAETFAHALSFGVTLAAVTNVAQYIYWKCKPRKGSHGYKYGPFYLALVSIFFVMASITDHVFLDAQIPFTPVWITNGWYTAATYIGFVLLMAGAIWSANLIPKLIEGFKQIRGQTNNSVQ